MTEVLNGAWPDLAGRLLTDAKGHVLGVRVYFEDTDFSGLVYHTSYLRWCERGRSDYLRLLGLHHNALYDDDRSAFVVRRLTIDYLKPARIDEVLEIITRPGRLGQATIDLDQEVRRGAELLAKIAVQLVLIDGAGRPRRLKGLMREVMGEG